MQITPKRPAENQEQCLSASLTKQEFEELIKKFDQRISKMIDEPKELERIQTMLRNRLAQGIKPQAIPFKEAKKGFLQNLERAEVRDVYLRLRDR